MSQEEILDKSKDNGLTKTITTVQIIYFVLSLCARKARNIAISQLELMMLAFPTLVVATYITVWDKPQDIQVPTVIHLERLSDNSQRAREIAVYLELDRCYNAVRGMGRKNPLERPSWHIFSLLTMSICAGLHCLAWKFTFPSDVERIYWRVAAIATLCIPVPFVGIYYCQIKFLTKEIDKEIDGEDSEENHWDLKMINFLAKKFVVTYFAFPSLAIYGFARLLLIGIAFSSLRSMPSDVYLTTWSKYLPSVQ